MAKIIKVTGYLVAHDDLDEERVARAAGDILSDKFECVNGPFVVQSTPLGISFFDEAWDNHPLNRIDCSMDVCEQFFAGKDNMERE